MYKILEIFSMRAKRTTVGLAVVLIILELNKMIAKFRQYDVLFYACLDRKSAKFWYFLDTRLQVILKSETSISQTFVIMTSIYETKLLFSIQIPIESYRDIIMRKTLVLVMQVTRNFYRMLKL